MKKQLKATAVYMMHCNRKKEGIWGMKIVKNMMVIMAVLMVGAVVAKNLEVQQQPVTTTQQPVIGARTQQIRPGVVQRQVTPALSTQASKSINPEEWKQIIAELTLPGRIPSKSQINEIRQFNLTNDQKVTLN